MEIFRDKLFFVCLFVIALTSLAQGVGQCGQPGAHKSALDIYITAQCNDEKIGTILKKAVEQNGYQVQLDDKLADILVSGVFRSVSLEEFLQRSLKNENYSLIVDEESRFIKIWSPGKNNNSNNKKEGNMNSCFRPLGDNSREIDNREKQGKYQQKISGEQKYKDSVSRLTMSEVENIHKAQLLNANSKGLNTVEPVSGIDIAIIEGIHRKQEEVIKKIRSEPKSILAGIGISRQALEEIHRNQKKALKDSKRHQ